MYLRTISRRNKDGTVVRYLQLAHNVRNERGNAVAEVVHSFGREDELDRDALARLVRSISRFLDPEQALAASVGSELTFTGSRPYGGAYLLDALWQRLGIDRALRAAAAGRKVTAATERLVFTLVANRALDPCSKRHALEWATAGVQLCLGRTTAVPAQRQPETASELPLLLSLRYRIRNDLGLGEDEYDHLLDEA